MAPILASGGPGHYRTHPRPPSPFRFFSFLGASGIRVGRRRARPACVGGTWLWIRLVRTRRRGPLSPGVFSLPPCSILGAL